MQRLTKIAMCLLAAAAASASACDGHDLGVQQVQRYHDGNIFVILDGVTTCSCSQPARMAFHENDPGAEFLHSMVLVAYTSGTKVDVGSNASGCPIHGNTARLTYLKLNPT